MSKLVLADAVPAQYDKAKLQDIIRAICGQVNSLSEGRLAARYNAQASVPGGTSASYAVGDFVPDSNCTVTNGTVRLGWVCVAPGTPGTFQEARVVTNSATSIAKVWLLATYSGGTPSAAASLNVSSLTDTAVGVITVNFSTAFSSANYAVVVSGGSNIASNASDTFFSNQASGSVQMNHYETSGAGTQDATMSMVAFGNQ